MQIPFIIKDKNLKFFIGTGNLRTRGHFKHPGPAQMPTVLRVGCAPAACGHTDRPSCLACHPPSHHRCQLWGPTWKLPLPGNEVRSTAPPAASHGGLSSREDGSKRQEEQEARPGPLASLPVLGHPPSLLSAAPAAPRPGSASRGPTAGPVGAPP